ncbi:MAG: M12 family metallopeptidase [Chloroflexota bacterium]
MALAFDKNRGWGWQTDPSLTIVCTPKSLPRHKWIPAAKTAFGINPINYAPMHQLARVVKGYKPTISHLAVVRTSYWHTNGVRLTVGFLDDPPQVLRKRILSHMNAWAKTARVRFVETKTDPQVRIARSGGVNGGYWSYIGTDILHISANQPTLNLEGFTMQMPEAEFHRVVRHETGHTLGFPHEHMRRQLVKLIAPTKAIAFFKRTQHWSAQETRDQVLTPIEESSLLATPQADPNSIMCYQIPAAITKNGQPIIGGLDIDAIDYAFAAQIYPKPGTPPATPRRVRKKRKT